MECLNWPPLKYSPFTNSSKPSSSKPIPARVTLFASNWGLISLSSVDHSRHNCHPNLRKNTTTAVFFSQILLIATICRKNMRKSIILEVAPEVARAILHTRQIMVKNYEFCWAVVEDYGRGCWIMVDEFLLKVFMVASWWKAMTDDFEWW